MTNGLSRLEAGGAGGHGGSVASDSRLLDDELDAEMRVMLRRPGGKKAMARPQSEAFLLDRMGKGTSAGASAAAGKRKSKRYSAFGVSSLLL